jgi:hypothetical protein
MLNHSRCVASVHAGAYIREIDGLPFIVISIPSFDLGKLRSTARDGRVGLL